MRQYFWRAILLFFGVASCALGANAESFPNRPVKILVGFAAGGTLDTITRIYADRLSQQLGKQFIVENMPGAGGNIAGAAAARARPDGYTLLLANNANTTGVSLYEKLSYDFLNDFEPVAMLARAPTALVASPELKANSVKELIALAKSRPGELVYGSAGVGTGTHMAAELFQLETDTKMTHVPYKALSGALVDLSGARISLLFSPLGTVIGPIKAAQVKALAVTTEKRTQLAPDIPTMAESGGPNLEVNLWLGFVVPKGTPKEAIQAIGQAVLAIQKNSDLAAKLAPAGGEPLSLAFNEFGEFMQRDVNTWAKVVQHTGLKIKQ